MGIVVGTDVTVAAVPGNLAVHPSRLCIAAATVVVGAMFCLLLCVWARQEARMASSECTRCTYCKHTKKKLSRRMSHHIQYSSVTAWAHGGGGGTCLRFVVWTSKRKCKRKVFHSIIHSLPNGQAGGNALTRLWRDILHTVYILCDNLNKQHAKTGEFQ